MIDPKLLRTDPDRIRRSLEARGEASGLVDDLIAADERRRELIASSETMRAEQKDLSRQVPKASAEERPALLERTKDLAQRVKDATAEADAAKARFDELMLRLPNLVIDGVPTGGEDDLYVIETHGTPRDFAAEGFTPRDHIELGEALGAMREGETGETAGMALDVIAENARIAASDELPLCQDCGSVIFFVEIGQDVSLEGAPVRQELDRAVEEAYRRYYLRKSIVRDPLRRENTGTNAPCSVHADIVTGSPFRLSRSLAEMPITATTGSTTTGGGGPTGISTLTAWSWIGIVMISITSSTSITSISGVMFISAMTAGSSPGWESWYVMAMPTSPSPRAAR